MKFKSFVVAAAIALSFGGPTLVIASDHTKVVEKHKAALEARGVNLKGACGAFQITERVAWELRGQGFKFLIKKGGNRAVPQPDGSCLDGDQTSAPGYATDYLIALDEGGVGYDLLGDGGGENKPQWAGPENAADMVDRNKKNWADPFNPGDPGGSSSNPPAEPPVTPAPAPAPASVDLTLIQNAIGSMAAHISQLEAQLNALVAELDKADQEATDKINVANAKIEELQSRKIPQGCRVQYLRCRLE